MDNEKRGECFISRLVSLWKLYSVVVETAPEASVPVGLQGGCCIYSTGWVLDVVRRLREGL